MTFVASAPFPNAPAFPYNHDCRLDEWRWSLPLEDHERVACLGPLGKTSLVDSLAGN